MRSVITILFLFAFKFIFSQQVAFSSLNDLAILINSKATFVDSTLKSKGFVNNDVNGLTFIYTKKTERFIFQSSPREFVYAFEDKSAYLSISSHVAENDSLISSSDTIVYNKKKYRASTFQGAYGKISFWTEYNSAQKTTSYFIKLIQVIVVEPVKIETTEVSTSTAEQTKKPEISKLVLQKTSSKKQVAKTTVSDSTIRQIEVKNDLSNTIPVKKVRLTGGIGVYGYVNTPGPGWNGNVYDDPEWLVAYNLGAEISKKDKMKQMGKFQSLTYIDVNFTTFLGMQRYYASGITASNQTMYLSKNFLTTGLTSELRRKNESFLMSFCPGLNWTSGKIEGVGRENFFTLCVQMGEYYQHNFWSKKKSKELLFLRAGFEQFFSFKGGYIGQFALTLGY